MDAGPRAELSASTERHRRLVGIALMGAAVACFACLDTTAKWLSGSLHPLLIVWARFLSSVLLVSVFVNPWTTPGLLRTRRPWLQVGRAFLLFGSTALNVFALQHLQVAQTTSIVFAMPLLVALVAGPLLGEWVGPRRLAAVAVGFVGVLVITRPGFGGLHPAAFLSLAGTVCYALYSISTRLLASSDSTATTLFYSGLPGVLLVTPVLPWIWSSPSPLVALMMVAIGAFGAIGHCLLILAHALAPAGTLAPFTYTQILWAFAFGYLLFGDVPDGWTLLGAAIVIASGLYLLYRERVRGVGPRAPA